MSQELQRGAINAIIEVDVEEDGEAVDLSPVLTKTLYFRKPNGDTVSKAASFVTDGTDGKLQYVTEDADFLDQAGIWKVQAFLEFPGSGYEGRGHVGQFPVRDNI